MALGEIGIGFCFVAGLTVLAGAQMPNSLTGRLMQTSNLNDHVNAIVLQYADKDANSLQEKFNVSRLNISVTDPNAAEIGAIYKVDTTESFIEEITGKQPKVIGFERVISSPT